MTVLIGCQLGVMFKLFDFEFQLCQDSFIFLKESLHFIVIGINDHEFILKFFGFPLLVLKLITEFLTLEFLVFDLFLVEVNVFRGFEVCGLFSGKFGGLFLQLLLEGIEFLLGFFVQGFQLVDGGFVLFVNGDLIPERGL